MCSNLFLCELGLGLMWDDQTSKLLDFVDCKVNELVKLSKQRHIALAPKAEFLLFYKDVFEYPIATYFDEKGFVKWPAFAEPLEFSYAQKGI